MSSRKLRQGHQQTPLRRADDYVRGVAFRVSELELAMLAKGWVRSDLAKASGVSEATLVKVFRGEKVSLRTAQRITLALNAAEDKVDRALLARIA